MNQETRGIEDHPMHSTLREVRNVHGDVQWICESDSSRALANKTGLILYLTDNQATSDTVMAMHTYICTYFIQWVCESDSDGSAHEEQSSHGRNLGGLGSDGI